MKGQLYLDTGLDKLATAIKRLVDNEPIGGYELAFGGGKDSVVIQHLASLSRVSHTSRYARTGIDAPELVRFIREHYPRVEFIPPKMTMWQGIELKGLPTRKKRWCCEYLKHFSSKGKVTITGIRWAESPRRKKYGVVDIEGKRIITTHINPIIDWTTYEVWDYIKTNNLPYCSLYDDGFARLGCLICPMTTRRNRLKEATLYPKIAEAYKRANRRFYARKEESIVEADEYFEKWINYP